MTAFFDTIRLNRRLIYQANTQQLSPPPPFPNGWVGYFPEAFAKPFPVTEQQFSAPSRDSFPGTLTSLSPLFFGDFREAFAKPFAVSEQQFSAIRFDLPPIPQGWPFQQPDVFGKPFIQRDFAVLGFPAPPTPQGWVGDFGWKFSVPINAALQQFWSARLDPAAIPGATPGPTGWVGYQPEAFSKALNAALQQYVAFQPQGAITSTIPAAIDPWYPDPKLLKKLLDRLKANEALRWKQLSQPDKRRLKLRAAVEIAYHGITEERKAPTAKALIPLAEDPAPVVKAVKALGVTVQRRDYDFIINSVRQYEKQAQFDRDDEEDIELLLLQM